MSWFSRQLQQTNTFHRQQLFVIMLACSIVLSASLAGTMMFEFISFSRDSKTRLASLADIIAAETSAALLFNDNRAINKTLQSLEADPDITQLFVLNVQGEIVGWYGRKDQPQTPRDVEQNLKRIRQEASRTSFELSPGIIRPIILDGEQLGSILVELDSKVFVHKILMSGGIGILIMALSMLVSYLLARRLGQVVTAPIQSLAATMELVTVTRNYDARTDVHGVLELTRLSEGFNTMLGEIARRDAALLESEEKYRTLYEDSRDALFILEPPSWKFTSGNQAALDMFWVNDEKDFISHGPWEFSPEKQPDGRASIDAGWEMMQTALRDGYHLFEWVHRRVSGEEFPAEVFLTRIEEGGQFIIQSTVRDITDRKRAEDESRESGERYRALFAGAGDGIFILSTEGKLIDVNESLARMHGYSVPEMLQIGLKDIDTPETARLIPERMQRILAGEALTFEVEHYHRDGHTFPLEVSAGLISYGGESYVQCFYRDISERKRAEEERIQLEQQLQHAQKLESLGVLAGGIAHDFNNILTVILGHCYMAGEGLDSEQEYKAAFQKVEAAGNRAADLCRQMLTYAGKTEFVQTSLSLWLLVDEVVKMLQSAIKKNVTIELDLEQRIPAIKGDSGQIQQVVMNLIINAAEAIGDANGTIRVALTKTIIEADKTETDTFGNQIKAGRYVCLEVTDTGCGMDEETQKKIFEPFFTTKFTGRGLGMSAIQGIIKSHEGILQLSSTPGTGTTFKVYFPIPAVVDYSESIPVTPVPYQKTGGTILLVEDELTLREMGIVLMETLGFSVLTAQHGLEALEIYRERGSEIDVILLDMIMPVMGGIETYHQLRKIAPTIPIIICSGYSDEPVKGVIDEDTLALFVKKPYKPDDLRNIMLRMMGTGQKNN